MSRLALYLLGPPRVERGGESLKIAGRKAMALLVYLAVTGRSQTSRRHSRDSLATLLWPESNQSHARAELRRELSTLRRTLGEGFVEADRETVGLNPDDQLWLDVETFRQRLAECETHGHVVEEVCADCVPLLEEAAALYRDDFMAGFTLRDSLAFDEWQFFQTEEIRGEVASALERMVRGHSGMGAHEAALAYARRWLALDPLQELVHRELMELYAQTGQRAAAVRQYRECVRVLEEELSVPPSAETTALYGRIQVERGRAAPAAPPRAAAPAELPTFLAEGANPTATDRPVFVAREREMGRLAGLLGRAVAGQGQVVFITGGPGRGKTTLMKTFASQAMAAHPDLLVASGACNAYSGVGDPYQPFREVLSMLTGDVQGRWAAGMISRAHARRLWTALPLAAQILLDHGPYLIDTLVPGRALLGRATVAAAHRRGAAPDANRPGWLERLESWANREHTGRIDMEQRALYEPFVNVLRTLAGTHPLLLLLDDLQWADSGSIHLLFHLGRQIAQAGVRIFIVGAYRPEEVSAGRNGKQHPLEPVLDELRRQFGDARVDLAQSDETGGQRFVEALLDAEANRLGEDFRAELSRRTGGHPLFTVELLRALQERGDLIQDPDGHGAWVEGPALDWEMLPARVEAVIAERVGRLNEGLRDILTVASVEGESFTAQVIAQVQSIPEREVLRALSQELEARHRLVREGEEAQVGEGFLSRYQFAHALFQEYVYQALSAGERRLLHGEVAEALEALLGDWSEEAAVQLARHYDEAGKKPEAVEYLLCAGERARSAYANEEALAHYERALTLLESVPATERSEPWRLRALRGLGQTHYEFGHLTEAEAYLREAITLGRKTGVAPSELVPLYWWLGETLSVQGRYAERIRAGEEGLSLLEGKTASPIVQESLEAALIYTTLSIGHFQDGNWETAREIVYRTAGFVNRLPYVDELRTVYLLPIYWCRRDKNVEGAMQWLHLLERETTSHQDLVGMSQADMFAGQIFAGRLDAGDLEAGTGELQRGLDRYKKALQLAEKTGNTRIHLLALRNLGQVTLELGDFAQAKDTIRVFLEQAQTLERQYELKYAFWQNGLLALCQGDWVKAENALQKAFHFCLEVEMAQSFGAAVALYGLGRLRLARGNPLEALTHLKDAFTQAGPHWWSSDPIEFFAALSSLEQAYELAGDSEAFYAYCQRYGEAYPEIGDQVLEQWVLKPIERRDYPRYSVLDNFAETLSSEWTWQDPFGDCSYLLGDGLEIPAGLEVRAANGRDLWHVNLSAPRLLRPLNVAGDFAVQTVCRPVSDATTRGHRPASGGLLLWQDKENYLRLDRGTRGEREISFQGCLENQDVIIGRGWLEIGKSANRQMGTTAGSVFLRLERVGEWLRALCSADGEEWFSVGSIAFPVQGPVQVGLHAIGHIDRTIYHGAFPEGTAIRFESFELWDECESPPR